MYLGKTQARFYCVGLCSQVAGTDFFHGLSEADKAQLYGGAAQQTSSCVPEISWRSVPGWGLCLLSLVRGRSHCLVLRHQDLSIHLNSALVLAEKARGKEASKAVNGFGLEK